MSEVEELNATAWTSDLPLDMLGQILTTYNVKQTGKFLCSSKYVSKMIGWRYVRCLDLITDFRENKSSIRLKDNVLVNICPRIQQWLPHVESLLITSPCVCSWEAQAALCNLLQAISPFLRNVTLGGWLGAPIREAVIPHLNLSKLESIDILLSSAAGPFFPLFSGALTSLKHVSVDGMELADSREILFLLAQNTTSLRTLKLRARYFFYGDGLRAIIQTNPQLEHFEAETMDNKGHIPLNCLLSIEPSSVDFSGEDAPPIPVADWVKLGGWCKERVGIPISKCKFEGGHSAWMACVSRALKESDKIEIPACDSLFNECYPTLAAVATATDVCDVLITSHKAGASDLQEWALKKLVEILRLDPSLRGAPRLVASNELLEKLLQTYQL